MSALSLFDFGPSGLSRPRINFPNFLFENMERSFRSMKSELSFSPNTEVKRDGENLELSYRAPPGSNQKTSTYSLKTVD